MSELLFRILWVIDEQRESCGVRSRPALRNLGVGVSYRFIFRHAVYRAPLKDSGFEDLPGLRRRNEFRLKKAAAILLRSANYEGQVAAALHMRMLISQFEEYKVLKNGHSVPALS